jgi:hypothetical protein
MALPPKKAAAPVKATSTQVNSYLEEMAADATEMAEQETKAASGQFISFKGAEITVDGTKLPGAQMAIIILDGVFENREFKDEYDPDNLANPRCFAFGRDEKTMVPHEMSEEAQCENCATCPWNKWKSSLTGTKKGKHCKNIRRVAFIPAGQFVNGQFEAIVDPDHFQRAQIRHMHVPVTSVGDYSGYIKSVSKSLVPARPAHMVYTRCWVVKDDKTNIAVHFELLDYVPDELYPVMKSRHTEAVSEIEFPYEPMANDEAPAPTAPAPKVSAPSARGALPAKRPLPRPGAKY